MNILVHGYIYSQNYGDIVFAKMFINKLISNHHKVFFIHSNNSLYDIAYNVKKELCIENTLNLTDACKLCDAIVVCGGGMFSQLNEYDNPYVRFCRFVFPIKCFLAQHKPVYIVGVDVGNIYNNWLESEIIDIMKRSDVLFVRNKLSDIYLKNHNCYNQCITADTAHLIETPNTFVNNKQILIHYTNRYNKLVESIILPVIKEKYSDYKLVFISDNDKNDITNTVFSKYGEIHNYENTNQITNIISESSFIITFKLHVGIVGAALGKSVIAFPFNYDKVYKYYNDIGEEDRCIPINKLTKDIVQSQISKFIDKPIKLSNTILKLSEKNLQIIDTIKCYNTDIVDVDFKKLFYEITEPVKHNKYIKDFYESEL